MGGLEKTSAAKAAADVAASPRSSPFPWRCPSPTREFPNLRVQPRGILGGSWDLVSRVISTLIGVISKYNYSYLTYNPTY